MTTDDSTSAEVKEAAIKAMAEETGKDTAPVDQAQATAPADSTPKTVAEIKSSDLPADLTSTKQSLDLVVTLKPAGETVAPSQKSQGSSVFGKSSGSLALKDSREDAGEGSFRPPEPNAAPPLPPIVSPATTPTSPTSMENGSGNHTMSPPGKLHAPPPPPADNGKDMLIAVVSSPKHVGARRAIRQTYMQYAQWSGRADVKFFVGQLADDVPDREKLDKEITSEPEMVRLTDFTESYHNLSYKALDIFKYGYDHGYRSVFKVDDDTYVRVSLALEFYDNHMGDPNLYAGDFVDGGKAMVDDPNSKWYMKDQYPHDRLEDYANGPGVLLGRNGIRYLATNFDSLFRYRVDDAAIAIWLKDVPMNKQQMSTDMYSHYIHPDTVWVNPVNSAEMVDIHMGTAETLQVCRETCLCWGGPKPEGDCLGWGEFMTAGYRDLIPRLALMQVEASMTS